MFENGLLENAFIYFSPERIWNYIVTYGAFHVGLYIVAFIVDRLFFGPFESSSETRTSIKHDFLTLGFELINGRMLLGNVLLFGGVLYAEKYLPSLRLDLYFREHPLLLLPIYLLLYDFLLYWYHRLSHLQPFWIQHEYHHAATALNPLSDLRIHALSYPFLLVMVLIPIRLLFRVPPDMILIFFSSLDILSILSHSRWNTSYGWFGKYIIVSPLYHRAHHSLSHQQHSNFGTYFAFWDHLFGTYTDPSGSYLLKTGVYSNPFLNKNEGLITAYIKVYQRFFQHCFKILK